MKEITAMNFEGIYCFDTATVRFAVYPDGPEGVRILAQISEETLHDEFGVREGGAHLLAVCRTYFNVIEAKVLERYRSNPTQPITLTVEDFGVPLRGGAAASMAATASRGGRASNGSHAAH
jgi:hypothetical protein